MAPLARFGPYLSGERPSLKSALVQSEELGEKYLGSYYEETAV
jgi:hypothetical protein